MYSIIFLICLVVIFAILFIVKFTKNKKFGNTIERTKEDAEHDKIAGFKLQDKTKKSHIDSAECMKILVLLENGLLDDANYDIRKLLATNPDNELAKTLSACNFYLDHKVGGEIELFDFDILPMELYIDKNSANINYKTLLCFLRLLSNRYDINFQALNCFKKCLLELKYYYNKRSEYAKAINYVATMIANNIYADKIKKSLKKSIGAGLKTFIWTNNEYLAAGMDSMRDDMKYYNKLLQSNKKVLANKLIDYAQSLKIFSEDEKKAIINKIHVEIFGF